MRYSHPRGPDLSRAINSNKIEFMNQQLLKSGEQETLNLNDLEKMLAMKKRVHHNDEKTPFSTSNAKKKGSIFNVLFRHRLGNSISNMIPNV